MADTLETQATRITGTSVAEAVQSIHKAPTGVLKRALELEQAKEGGGRSTLTASLRGELRRRGFLRRSAAQRGEADPGILVIVGTGMWFLFLLALIWSAPACADDWHTTEWGGAPALRFGWFPDDARCTRNGGSHYLRPQLQQPIVREGLVQLYGVLEHGSCLDASDRGSGDNRLGVVLEVQF